MKTMSFNGRETTTQHQGPGHNSWKKKLWWRIHSKNRL